MVSLISFKAVADCFFRDPKSFQGRKKKKKKKSDNSAVLNRDDRSYFSTHHLQKAHRLGRAASAERAERERFGPGRAGLAAPGLCPEETWLGSLNSSGAASHAQPRGMAKRDRASVPHPAGTCTGPGLPGGEQQQHPGSAGAGEPLSPPKFYWRTCWHPAVGGRTGRGCCPTDVGRGASLPQGPRGRGAAAAQPEGAAAARRRGEGRTSARRRHRHRPTRPAARGLRSGGVRVALPAPPGGCSGAGGPTRGRPAPGAPSQRPVAS